MRQVHILLILTALLTMVTAQMAEATSEAAVLYLRVAPGARPAGMGEAFVSIADDATATYWNPAGLGNDPIAGMMKTRRLSPSFGQITDVVTLEGATGGIETWVIADNRLLLFDGEGWSEGKDYRTSSDQLLVDFLKTIINTENEDQLRSMAEQVRIANCPVPADKLDDFIERVRGSVPADYNALEDLGAGLENLKIGFEGCLLIPDQFGDLLKKLEDGLADGTLTAEETDRITYSLDRALYRFLPSRLTVPFSVGIDGNLTALGATSRYLWVGTDNGLFRRANRAWARFGTDVLPSVVVTGIAKYDDNLLIGTERGVVSYYHGGFSSYASLPQAPVESVTLNSATSGYAVIDGVVYAQQGDTWTDYYTYTVRLDDTMEKLVARTSVYHTSSEAAQLEKKIRELNAALVPVVTPPAASAEPAPVESADQADSVKAVVEEAVAESISPDAAETESAPTEQTVVFAPDGQWLVEGNVIKLPYSPPLRYQVTALAVDLDKVLWVGTTGGLLSFDGLSWTRYGYQEYVVRATADSGQSAEPMTAEEIARVFMPVADSGRISLLAACIDDYNELDGAAVEPGRTVSVYNSNLGSPIHSLGINFGELYVGTEYGLVKKSDEGWEEFIDQRLHRRQVIGTYDHDGQSYFVSTNAVTTETKGSHEVVLMHVNWLPTLDLDMYYEFLSYVHHVRGIGSFGLSIIYLNYGEIQFMGEGADAFLGYENPYEFTVALSYGTSLSSSIKWGLTGKFIHSHLSSVGAGEEQGDGIASAFAVDFGVLVKLTDRLQFGSAITNIGPEITYVDAAQNDPLPRNLGVGLSYKLVNSQYNRLIIQGELNRMLTSLNDGFSKELEFAIRHVGAEYWYANLIALRAGYKYDKEGEVKHMTFGAGLQLKGARLDFAYIPSSEDSPLSNTLRISGTMNF